MIEPRLQTFEPDSSAVRPRALLETIQQGRGVLVFDNDGCLIRQLLHELPDSREADVCLIDPTDRLTPPTLDVTQPPADEMTETDWAILRLCANRQVGLNLLGYTAPTEQAQVIAETINTFEGLDHFEPGNAFHRLGLVALAVPLLVGWRQHATLADFHRFLVDPGFRQVVLLSDHVPVEMRLFWETHTDVEVTRLIAILHTLLTEPYGLRVIDQRLTTLDFTDIVRNHRLVLALLPETMGPSAHYLTALLINKLRSVYEVQQANEPSPLPRCLDESALDWGQVVPLLARRDDQAGQSQAAKRHPGEGQSHSPAALLSLPVVVGGDDLARLNFIDSLLPDERLQFEMMVEPFQTSGDFRRFRQVRQARDAGVRKRLLRQPALIADKVARIWALSSLRYGTPGYEICFERQRATMQRNKFS